MICFGVSVAPRATIVLRFLPSMSQRSIATVPRILATILNESVVARMVMLLRPLSYSARFVPLLNTYSFRAELTCSILLRLQCTTTHRAVPGRHAMIYRVGSDLI